MGLLASVLAILLIVTPRNSEFSFLVVVSSLQFGSASM